MGSLLSRRGRARMGWSHPPRRPKGLLTSGFGRRFVAATTLEQIRAALASVRAIKVGESVRGYIRGITQATRGHANLRLGVSPRGALALRGGSGREMAEA